MDAGVIEELMGCKESSVVEPKEKPLPYASRSFEEKRSPPQVNTSDRSQSHSLSTR